MWWKLLTLCLCGTALAAELEVINQWTLLDFDFPDIERIQAFRPENTVFTGLEVTDDKIFLAMPRLRPGVPATLAFIPRSAPKGSSPPLQAYPNWNFHQAGIDNKTCEGLVSVYRMRQDSCNRLWVLDSGVQSSLDDFTRVCQPKLVIFDLASDQVVRTVVFPKEVQRPATLMANLVIDESIQGKCDNAIVYMTDTAAPGIVVYDAAKDSIWRFTHPSMFPDPNFADYNIGGDQFTLMDGVVGLAHSPSLNLLYFQPLATDRIFSVPTTVLVKGPLAENENLPVALVGKKSSQGLGLALDPRDDTLYFSPLAETSLASWNPRTNKNSLVVYDPTRLQFMAEIRWIQKDAGAVWGLSTRFQKFFLRNVNGNEVNLRVVRITERTTPTFPVNNNLQFF